MSLFYPALVIGLGSLGKKVADEVYRNASGHADALTKGIQCVAVCAYPTEFVGEIEAPVEDLTLPAFHWFPEKIDLEDIYTPAMPVDPDATLSLDLKYKITACKSFLKVNLDPLLGISIENELASAGIELMKPGNTKHLNIVLVCDLNDNFAWMILPEIVNQLREIHSTSYSYLHLIPILEESGDAGRFCRAKLQTIRRDLLPPFRTHFSFICCYPFSDQLDDLTILPDKDEIVLQVGFFIYLYLLPFTDNSSPLEEAMKIDVPDAVPSPRRRTKHKIPPMVPCIAAGTAACYVPIAELRRRIGFHVGYHLLSDFIRAESVEDPESVTTELIESRFMLDLQELPLLSRLITGLLLEIKTDAVTGKVSEIITDEKVIRETIRKAALNRWVELVDNYDYMISIRMSSWHDTIDANCQRLIDDIIVNGDERLPLQVDKVMQSYSKSLATADLMIDVIRNAVNEEKHPSRNARASVSSDARTEREALIREAETLPSGASLAARSLLLAVALSAISLLFGGTGISGLSGSVLSIILVALSSWLHWKSRHTRMIDCLENYLTAVRMRYQNQLLAKVIESLNKFDLAVESWADKERDQIRVLRSVLHKVETHYDIERKRFHVSESGFIESAVNPDDVSVLYDKSEYPSKIELIAKEIMSSGFVGDWRSFSDTDADVKSIRHTLWPIIRLICLNYRLDCGIDQFVSDVEVEIQGLFQRIHTGIRHRHLPDISDIPSDYIVCPSSNSPCYAKEIACSSGVSKLMPDVPNVLGVLRIEHTIEPEDNSES